MLTYQDCVEHLITSSFGGPQDAEQRDIRTAVQRAYQEVAWIRDWEFYHTHGRIIFNDDWIGSITYSSATRTLTKVTGDAFPLDATRFHLRIGDIVCRIQSRTSDTVLVLDSTLKLSDDIDEAVEARDRVRPAADQDHQRPQAHLPADATATGRPDEGDEQERHAQAQRAQARFVGDAGGGQEVRRGEGRDDRAEVERSHAAVHEP